MVADGHGVVAHGVHDEHHGIDGEGADGDGDAGGKFAGQTEVLVHAFEGSTLDRIAGIDEERVGCGFAFIGNEGGDFGEAVVGRFLREVVVRVDVAVEIGGGEDGDFSRLSGKVGRRNCEAE